ncbi:hypothetical protein D3C71_1092160 [compost metagenome]
MKILDIVPSWLWALLLVVAMVVTGSGWMQLFKARADVSLARKAVTDEKLERQAENTLRALAALNDLQRVLALQVAHAKNQQENVSAYENKLDELDGRRRAAAAGAQRLREQYAAFAARDREQSETDPAACIRIANRSAVLAGMAARGRELLERGRFVVERRDAEVAVLMGVVTNDRRLLEPAMP